MDFEMRDPGVPRALPGGPPPTHSEHAPRGVYGGGMRVESARAVPGQPARVLLGSWLR